MPSDLGQDAHESVSVSELSVIEAKRLLIDISLQMHRIDTHVGPFQCSLKQAPKILDSVCMNAAFDIRVQMVHKFPRNAFRQVVIRIELVGIEFRSWLNVCRNMRVHLMSPATRSDSGANLAFALEQSKHYGFAPVPIV